MNISVWVLIYTLRCTRFMYCTQTAIIILQTVEVQRTITFSAVPFPLLRVPVFFLFFVYFFFFFIGSDRCRRVSTQTLWRTGKTILLPLTFVTIKIRVSPTIFFLFSILNVRYYRMNCIVATIAHTVPLYCRVLWNNLTSVAGKKITEIGVFHLRKSDVRR